jgi:hypothetical protein
VGTEYKGIIIPKAKASFKSKKKRASKIKGWLKDEDFLMNRVIIMLKNKKRKLKLINV